MKTTASWAPDAMNEGRDEHQQSAAAPRVEDWLDAASVPSEPLRDHGDEMRAIASELARLADRTAATAADPAKAAETNDALRVAVAEIARRQADLDRDAAGPPAAPPRHPSPAVELREELLASVASASWGVTRQGAVAADRAARELDSRARAGTDLAAEVSQTFARFGRDLRDAIEGMDARPVVEALNREVRQIGRTVDGLPKAEAIARFGEQAREVRDILRSVAAEPVPSDADGRHGAMPGPRFGRVAAVPVALPPDFASTMAEVRGLLDGFKPGATMAKLDARLEMLTRRIEDGLGAGDPGALLQSLSRRVDEIQTSLQAQHLSASSDTAPLQGIVDGLAERIAQAHAASADFQRLEEAMRDVAVQIGGAASGADPRTIPAIEAQLTRVAERLERSEASLRAMEGVEQQLGDLFSQFEMTRQVAVDAAETAARTAARDTLRAALQNPLLVQRQADAGPVIADQVARGLESMRTLQDQAERRTQNSLADLRATVERLAQALSADRTPAEPPRRERPATPAAVADADPIDLLIEPGLGRGTVATAAEPVVSPEYDGAAPLPEGDGPASFIAAARRAAKAAQASAAAQKHAERRAAGTVRDAAADGEAPEGGTLRRARAFLAARRRPALLGIAALVVAAGALEFVKLNLDGGDSPRATVAALAAPADDTGTAAAQKGAEAPPVNAQAGIKPSTLAAEAVLPPATQADGKPPLPTFVTGPAKVAASPDGVPEGLRSLAAAGDRAAEYEVGLRYAEGRGVPRDSKQAAAWFDKAAEQGLAPADYRLGSAYEKGLGVDRDPAQAMAWYSKAAEAGNVRAMHNLAVMSAEGSAGKSDYARAAQWFTKASDDGVRDSQFNLAILYARGLGVEQSFEKSYTWFAIAAAAGDEDAGRKRDEVASKLDAKQLAAAKAAADTFHAATPLPAANEVVPPSGGWDAATPMHTASPAGAKVSQL